MATYSEQKSQIENILERFNSQILSHLPDSKQRIQFNNLYEDVTSDFYTVVVLGEFKRGKSTFVNALLGQPLLPVDVTPTTATINAIMWGEEPSLTVHKMDGSTEQLELTNEKLKQYVVSDEFNPDTVKYLKITLENEILGENVVLVDTPGVDDLNQQRVDVTYNFIPRADAVLFLLDATSPVRRTEQEFLTDTILNQGLEKILFIANFMDEVEEEDHEETIDAIKRRLVMALNRSTPNVLPFSAREALEAQLEGDMGRLEESGYYNVKKQLGDFIEHGSRSEEKLARFQFRTNQILSATKREIQAHQHIQQMDEAELRKQLVKVEQVMNNYDLIKADLDDYVRSREHEIFAIVNKSMKNFGEELLEDVTLALEQFTGTNLKQFVEQQLPTMVKRRIKQWVEQYIGSIHKLFQMLEREIAVGIATELNSEITALQATRGEYQGSQHPAVLNISADDLSNTPILAGALAGGAGALAMLLGGPLLLPILGMAGYPFLQKHLMENRLEKAKGELRQELQRTMEEVLEQFSQDIHQYIRQNTDAIRNHASDRCEEIILGLKTKLNNEMNQKHHSKEELLEKRNRFTQLLEVTDQLMDELQEVTEVVKESATSG